MKRSRSYTFLKLAILGVFLALFGCSTPTSSPFYNGARAQWGPIRDTYNDYVDHDPRLTADDRRILKESSATMDDLIRREGARLASPTFSTTQP